MAVSFQSSPTDGAHLGDGNERITMRRGNVNGHDTTGQGVLHRVGRQIGHRLDDPEDGFGCQRIASRSSRCS